MHVKHKKTVLVKQRTRSRTQGMKHFLGKAAGKLATMAMVSSPPDRGLCRCPLCYSEENNQTNESAQCIKPEQQLCV